MRDYGAKHANIAQENINAGEENEVEGLLEQWLREGRLNEAEAVMTSADMFGAGVDTVSFNQWEVARGGIPFLTVDMTGWGTHVLPLSFKTGDNTIKLEVTWCPRISS